LPFSQETRNNLGRILQISGNQHGAVAATVGQSCGEGYVGTTVPRESNVLDPQIFPNPIAGNLPASIAGMVVDKDNFKAAI
jgi:hypothetical protein